MFRIASCSGEPYSTESYLNGASATCTCPLIPMCNYDDLHALSSHNRLQVHSVVA